MASLYFHQSFAPDADYIATLLELAKEEVAYTKEEISDITGIPTGKSSGKVEPFIQYAEFMGLLVDEYRNKKHLLKLTKLGSIVSENDPYLQEKKTRYICHLNLVSSKGAEVWHYMFKNFGNKMLEQEQLFFENLHQYGIDVEDTKKRAQIIGTFKSSYRGMFAVLGLLKEKNNGLKFYTTRYRKEYVFAYALAIYNEWDAVYSGTNEINEINLEKLELDKLMCLAKEDYNLILDELVREGIIRIDRQLSPSIIIRLKDSDYILDNLYSRM